MHGWHLNLNYLLIDLFNFCNHCVQSAFSFSATCGQFFLRSHYSFGQARSQPVIFEGARANLGGANIYVYSGDYIACNTDMFLFVFCNRNVKTCVCVLPTAVKTFNDRSCMPSIKHVVPTQVNNFGITRLHVFCLL